MGAAGGGIYVAEFKAASRRGLAAFGMPELETEAVHDLVPVVKGI